MRLTPAAALLLLLGGCASGGPQGPEGTQAGAPPVLDGVLAELDGGGAPPERPAEPEALSVPAGIAMELIADASGLASGLSPRRRFDLRVSGVEARTFFAGLAGDDPELNMIVHPDVGGAVSLEMKNVTVDEVMDVACELYRFDCRPFSGDGPYAVRGYKVFPWRLVTHTYRMDSLPVVRGGRSETSVSDSGGTGSSVRTRHDSDFWADLEQTLRSILELDMALSSVRERIRIDARGEIETDIEKRRGAVQDEPEDGTKTTTTTVTTEFDEEDQEGEVTVEKIEKGKAGQPRERPVAVQPPVRNGKSIVINRQAGLVTVRAYPKDHREIKAFLQQIRDRGQKQVILEGKILEVELSDGFQFGIDWLTVNKGLGSSRFSPLASEPDGGRTFVASQNEQTIVGTSVLNLNPLFSQGLQLARKVAGGPFSMAFREHDFIGFINLLKEQGKVQVLSSPRIATINNQKAVIKVGSDEIFITGLDSGSVSGRGDAARVTDPTAVFTSMFTGISLDVTPQIGDGEMVTLHVHPLVTEVRDREKRFTINDKFQSLPLAMSRTRETDSIIRVRDGEVAVIGGLMKRELTDQVDRLPWLGDLPGLGTLFSHVSKKWKRSELVILLRPVVVKERERGWTEMAMQAAGRMESLDRERAPW